MKSTPDIPDMKILPETIRMAVNPASKTAVAIFKNTANAPLVFFDGSPVFGHFQGNIEVLLTARMLGMKSDNTSTSDVTAVAQLRCSVQAAAYLRDALDQAIQMLNGQNEQAKH